MANEYLRRNFTSTGNLREGTFSFWMKGRPFDTNQTRPVYLYDGSNLFQVFFERTTGTNPGQIVVYGAGADIRYKGIYRDPSAWSHYLIKVDNTINGAEARFEVFVNGVRLEIVGSQSTTSAVYPTRDANVFNNVFYINGTGNGAFQVCDYFYVDGQALTPDVFGFYKTGKGYISAGSTVATDFRPGQWVPKSPRIIIADINSRGGFGVNGFYLPMNDSNNFGADFHCTPNSIIKLQENLPQPRSRIDGVGDYTGALRDDPFKQYLVLALPLVSNGLQNGFGDYSAAIKGSGTPKTVTSVAISGTGPSLTSTSPYYGTSAYFDGGRCLQVPAGSDFAHGTGPFTVECWVNPPGGIEPSGYEMAFLYSQTDGGHNYFWFGAAGNTAATGPGALYFFMGDGGGGANGGCAITVANIVPINQWSHIAATRDSANTVRLFLNGVCVATAQNVTYNLNNTTYTPTLGRYTHSTTSQFYKGYIQDFRIYKGVAKYTGGFDVPRPYTPVGISSWRAVPDTTANNFCTVNPLTKIGVDTIVYTDGNNTLTDSGSGGAITHGTFSINSGKWYYECRVAGINAGSHIMGWMLSPYSTDDAVWVRSNGTKYSFATNQVVSAFPTWANGDFIMIAYDHSTGRLWAGKNGTWYSSASATYTVPDSTNWLSQFTSVSGSVSPRFHYDNVGGTKEFIVNFGQNPTFSGNTTAGTFTDTNGKGLFKYQPPSGFLALCEDNLPAPAISDPGKHFKTVLYTGSNSSRSITGVGFKPDLVWIKSRSTAGSSASNNLYDSLRPTGSLLSSNETSAEVTYPGLGLSSFDVDGFSIVGAGSLSNESPNNYVAWCWKAGNTTTTNTNGSITSTVSVNQQAGFSIVSWTGNGASTVTVGHGLGKTPAFMILKARDAGSADSNWVIFHKSMGSGTFDKYMYFNTGGAGTLVPSLPANSNIFTSSNPGINSNNIRYITYCWAEIEGYSKFGSYVGNGDFDGPFVYCGFKPAWIMIKSINNENGWIIMDNARKPINPNGEVLFANDAMAEQTDLSLRQTDFLSNGFKIRAGIGSERNSSGTTYIFVAFAESPFQTANAK